MIYSFGDIRINTDTFTIYRCERPIHIEPLTLNLITFLILQRNRAVSRCEIFDSVWNGRIVSDASLSNEIKEARKILGDSGQKQNIIRTVHGHGYQFVAELNETAVIQRKQSDQLIDPGENLFESIPVHGSTFIGRLNELNAINETLLNKENRIISILGPGGIGKTSLAVQFAHESRYLYEGGIYFIPLVTETYAANVILHIAKCFNVPNHILSSNDPEQKIKTLSKYIPDRRQLIILDNFEHLLDASEDLALLCEESPHIQFIITTRKRTNLLNERAIVLEGLSHENEFNSDSSELGDAVKLFLDRASVELNKADLLENDIISIDQICRKLGGSPLGIVMAVSWLRIMNVETLASEVCYSMLNFQDPPLKLDPRHQKISHLFESSWMYLSDELQQIFMKMSVFTGGFDIESAAAVCNCSLAHLMALEQFSLIKIHPDGRFTVHELLRQFGEEKLKNSQYVDSTIVSLVNYFLNLSKDVLPHIMTQNDLPMLKKLRLDLPNFYKVCDISLKSQQWENVCDLIVFNSYVDNQVPRCFDINKRIIPLLKDKVPLKQYLKVLRQLLKGYRLMNSTDLVRLKLSREYVEIGKTLGHKGIEGEGYSFLNDCYSLEPDPGLDYQQYLELAYSCFKEYMDTYQGPENSHLVYYAIHLGDESASTGRWDDCKHYYLLAMAIAERIGDQRLYEVCFWGSALGYLLTGDAANGLLFCERSLNSYLNLENYLAYANRIPGVAIAAQLFGDYEQATHILGQAQGLIERITRRKAPAESFAMEEDIRLLKDALGEATYDKIWQKGKHEPLSVVVSYVNKYIESKKV